MAPEFAGLPYLTVSGSPGWCFPVGTALIDLRRIGLSHLAESYSPHLKKGTNTCAHMEGGGKYLIHTMIVTVLDSADILHPWQVPPFREPTMTAL